MVVGKLFQRICSRYQFVGALCFSMLYMQPIYAVAPAKHLSALAMSSFDMGDADALPQRLCDARQLQAWILAARKDRIQLPTDFVEALRTLWCWDPDPIVRRRRSRAYISPKVIVEPVGGRRLVGYGFLRGYETLWYLPSDLVFFVHEAGRRVRVLTTREGGGDELEWRVVNGKWQLVRFVDGGAC